MTRRRMLAISALLLGGFTAGYAGCAGARRQADFERDFHGGSRGARDAWFSLLATRYGCDTILLKAPGTEGLMTDATTCAAAKTVMPEVIRAWSDSTGVFEEWEYFGSHEGGGPGQTPWWGQSRRCKLTLRGQAPPVLRVSDITCQL